jgi:hypothetical protein
MTTLRKRPLVRLSEGGLFTVLLLCAVTAYTFLLYRRGLSVGVLSDGWELLRIGSLGLLRAPFVLLSYHTIPVTNLFVAVLWKLFGLHEPAYQILNIAELALVGTVVGLLGYVLDQPRVGLLGAFLFVSNSSLFEVPFWPVVGNFQSLTALLYGGGLLAVHRAGCSRRPALWAWLFAFAVLAAFFAYEPAVSLLPVGLLQAWLIPGADGGTEGTRSAVRRLRPFALPALACAVVVLGSKGLTAASGHTSMLLPDTWEALGFRILFVVRGCLAIFTLRSSATSISRVMTSGLEPPWGSPLYLTCLGLWVLGLTAGGVLLVRKARSPDVRFLVLWFAVHILTVSAAVLIVSRHYYLAAMPAALLLARLVWSIADRLAAAVVRRGAAAALRLNEQALATLLAVLALTVLTAGAKSDLDAAAALAKQATAASRQVASQILARLARSAAPPRVALLNMPAILEQNGIRSYAFVNGLYPLVRLSTGGRVADPDLLCTYHLNQSRQLANESRPISLGDLARRVQDPDSLVLWFDPRTGTVVSLDRVSWRTPASYTPDSAPYLEWQSGTWPWLIAYAGQPLELPLAVDQGSWVALRFLRRPGVRFTVTGEEGSPRLTVRAPDATKADWITAAFPLTGKEPAGPVRFAVQPESEVWIAGLWSFRPPPLYTPEQAPFLAWALQPVPYFVVTAPLDLPLAPPGGADRPCAIHVELLAEEGREAAVTIAGSPPQLLGIRGAARPEWQSFTVPAPAPGRPALVRIEPRGRRGAAVRRLACEPAPAYTLTPARAR